LKKLLVSKRPKYLKTFVHKSNISRFAYQYHLYLYLSINISSYVHDL
ncbi:hypothetical protein KSS87_013292, partial [Heliosperma pusillum]